MSNMNTTTRNVEATDIAIKKHILSSIPLMEKNKSHTLKEIFQLTAEGHSYWNNDIDPTAIGRLVSQMVKAGLLPLIHAGKATDNALLYTSI